MRWENDIGLEKVLFRGKNDFGGKRFFGKVIFFGIGNFVLGKGIVLGKGDFGERYFFWGKRILGIRF